MERLLYWLRKCIHRTTDSVNTSVSLASSMRSARETEAWIEREVALCFLERKIRMSD